MPRMLSILIPILCIALAGCESSLGNEGYFTDGDTDILNESDGEMEHADLPDSEGGLEADDAESPEREDWSEDENTEVEEDLFEEETTMEEEIADGDPELSDGEIADGDPELSDGDPEGENETEAEGDPDPSELDPEQEIPPCVDGPCCQDGHAVPVGEACLSGQDTLECTNDVCDSDLNCHPVLQNGKCLLDGVCYIEFFTNPLNFCQWCDAGTNTWGDKPETETCNDEDACTLEDKCTGQGECRGALYTCNDHGLCDQGICECTTGYAGSACDQCSNGTLGAYPYCFLPATAFCLTSQCFTVPPTNQTMCCDNTTPLGCPGVAGSTECGTTDFCGQDAQYPDLSRTFTCFSAGGVEADCSTLIPVGDNEVVVDSLTGMMWQRKLTSHMVWQDAVDYCSNLSYGGYSDWRLPNSLELQSIVDDGTFNPSANTIAFRGTPSFFFWTSNSHPTSTGAARYVSFVGGHNSFFNKTQSAYARCVRLGNVGSDNGTFNPYVVLGEGEQTVVDKRTGLAWQKSYTTNKTWSEAMAYCEALTYAGYSDWRLPNKKELATLLNYEILSPCSDFPSMPSTGFWTSSTYMEEPLNGWNVGFGGGDVYFRLKTDDYDARCVRGSP